ncbi:MAG: type II secretion system F family protein [Lachnospiraceae bacterium]|nr:type II secretion system F family protein [Lachnospiraceae bacterium]
MKKLTNTDLSYFCGQMAMIIKAGISSIEGLHMMGEDSEASAEEKKLYGDIQRKLEEGGYLYTALDSTGVFPSYMVNMTRIGEETGTLDNVMDALRVHYTREEEIRQSIRQAVTYPIVMAGMILVVILVLLLQVMPVFRQVFRQLGSEMTGFAGVMFDAGDAIRKYSLVIVAVLAVILLLIVICLRTEGGRKAGLAFLSNFSFFKKLRNDISTSRFSDGLALALRSGFSADFGIEMVSEIIDDKVFRKKIDVCKEKLNNGAPFDEALKESSILSGVPARMMTIGNRTGSADTVMQQISDISQKNIDTSINNALGAIEPVLIVSLSLIIGAILMSVIIPFLGMVSSI